jgi:tRNA pseudouridine38-40 synthase
MRIRLDVQYLGGPFEGWQVQETGPDGRVHPTIQGEIEGVLAKVHGCSLRIHGAGRTDAGVHATGQVAHLDLPSEAPAIPPAGLQAALNRFLPPEIRISDVTVPPGAFHSRTSAISKTYRYRYRRGRFLPPHAGLVESLVREELDVRSMQAAAKLLVGRRDFGPFSLTGSDPQTTVRTLYSLDVEEDGPLVVITAVGEGFLRGMVRRLAGTLRDVGRGRTPVEAVVASPGPTAEARGLTLEKVSYPVDPVPGSVPATR